MSAFSRRTCAAVAAPLVALPLAGATALFAAAPAHAVSDTVVISGHGFGHGRGMGQYGALGYALQGQSYTQILQHFYGNTAAGGIDPNTGISVQLVAADGKDAIVQFNTTGANGAEMEIVLQHVDAHDITATDFVL